MNYSVSRLIYLAADGRPLTRDAARPHMPRDLYIEWAATMTEMRRVGLIDDENRMTAIWREFHRSIVENSRPPAARPFVPSSNGLQDERGRGSR